MEVNAPTPTQIGQVARELDARHFAFTCNSSVEQRQKAFDSVHLLLQQIRNVPDTARANLRLRGDSLVAKAGNSYYPLIDNFTLPKQDGSTRNALQALRLNVPVTQSFKDKLLCVSSKIIGKITGSAIRDKHLTLTYRELTQLAERNLHALPISRGCPNGVMPHVDATFFEGRIEAALESNTLVGTPLHFYDLRGADLSNKDLRGCSLPMDLNGVNLTGARLYGVTFGKQSPFHAHLTTERWRDRESRIFPTYDAFEKSQGKVHPDFSGVQMQGAKLAMPSPFERDDQSIGEILDREYNHLNNTTSGSCLKSIHSIGDETVKRETMEKALADVLGACTAQDRTAIHEPLSDILFNRAYLDASIPSDQNKAVRTLVNEVVKNNFSRGSEKMSRGYVWPNADMKVYFKAHIKYAFELIGEGLDDNQASFCQQLIQICVQEPDTDLSQMRLRGPDFDLRQQALSLQKAIWAQPSHVTVLHSLCDTLGYDDAAEIELGEQLVFVNPDGDAVAFSRAYYETFVLNVPRPFGDVRLTNPSMEILFFKKTHDGHENVPVTAIGEQAAAFPILRAFLVPNLNRAQPIHLDILELGRYKSAFIEAAKSVVFVGRDPTSGELTSGDLTSNEDKHALADIFSPYMEDDSTHELRGSRATSTYVDAVLEGMGLRDSPDNERSFALRCLSALFANYSSSRMFGTEYDSPDAVRGFAAALLGSARERLARDATPATRALFKTFEDKLLGNKGFTCTAVLFTSMNEYLRGQAQQNPGLQSIYDKLIPPSWR